MADQNVTAASKDDPDLSRQLRLRRRQLRKLRAAHKSADIETAVAQAERMARRYPDDPEVRSEIAATYLAADELDLAIRSWRRRSSSNPAIGRRATGSRMCLSGWDGTGMPWTSWRRWPRCFPRVGRASN